MPHVQDQCRCMMWGVIACVQLATAVGCEVLVATRDNGLEYMRARVARLTATQVEVAYCDQQERETLERRSRRLWHGGVDEGAWEVRA